MVSYCLCITERVHSSHTISMQSSTSLVYLYLEIVNDSYHPVLPTAENPTKFHPFIVR